MGFLGFYLNDLTSFQLSYRRRMDGCTRSVNILKSLSEEMICLIPGMNCFCSISNAFHPLHFMFFQLEPAHMLHIAAAGIYFGLVAKTVDG